ncbi:capping complex subunit for YIEGIA [Paenibacillus sp. KN14-4R]|uniref:capping complex subunit for YIEGIA n=1 Tax=Paenibacillus sp. KN14-4R TaxID=3445773 RepID=UPI003FA169F2
MTGIILAVVTLYRDQVAGGAPIFHVSDEEQLQQTAFHLEKIMDAMAHDLQNGTMILVRH